MLECVHEEDVNFYADRAFEPLREEARIVEETREEIMLEEDVAVAHEDSDTA